MTARLATGLVAVAVAACACGAAGAASPRATPAAGSTAAAAGEGTASYVQKAALDPCPAASATTGGGLHPLTLPCLGNGPAVDLSRLRGPALVNMWGSWCDPCVEEVPLLERVHRAAKGRLLVLGVDIQEPSRRSPLAFAAAVGMHYPSLYDQDGSVRVKERVFAPPVTWFVDADGNIAYRKIGRYHSLAQLRTDIARYLGVAL